MLTSHLSFLWITIVIRCIFWSGRNTNCDAFSVVVMTTVSHRLPAITACAAAFVGTIPENEPTTTPINQNNSSSTKRSRSENDAKIVTVAPIAISSPRLWLESLPHGVYTVVRCSYNNNTWKMEGMEFHLQRLQESYALFHNASRHYTTTTTTNIGHNATMIQHARNDTTSIIAALQKEELWPRQASTRKRIIMLTILWYPNDLHDIVVMGHATPASTHPPPHIEIVLHHTTTNNNNKNDGDSSTTTPNRQSHPQPYAKVSSWCHERKPLERLYNLSSSPTCTVAVVTDNVVTGVNDTTTIQEVILTTTTTTTTATKSTTHQSPPSQVQLLEGLTSNLFVVYPNRVIRTAGRGVLFGYVRHLILELLSRSPPNNALPYTIDTATPILMEEAHEWQQVFCTSSIRLVVPVERIWVPHPSTTGTAALREIWRANTTTVESDIEPIWKTLRTLFMDTDES